ncbi:5207_t:CDS:2 [Entrophospora sp. SA101]|nr:5207_t:CDS:2 [Entrophospora sp. SA101]
MVNLGIMLTNVIIKGFMEASELLNPNFTVQELSDSLERF